MLTVIIPAYKPCPILSESRRALQKTITPLEVIIVAPENRKDIQAQYKNEKIIYSRQKGRGLYLAQGTEKARGDIIVYLHCDTLLPRNWDKYILKAMDDPRVAGGGFSLKFNHGKPGLGLLTRLSNLLYLFTGELWGDRALFIRSGLIKKKPELLKVPIMEDVILSGYIKSHGKNHLINKPVITSAATFLKRGIARHTLIILICRAMYTFKRDPIKIYNYYYGTNHA